MIKLKPKVKFKIPVEAECISPDTFSGESVKKIRNFEVHWGNKTKKLEDVFDIEQISEGTEEITIEGDVSAVKHIGACMSKGRVIIEGDVGMHLGREMSGGEIIVHGNVGDWLGAEMKGGIIRVKGNAGNLVGSGYRGSKIGMKGGMIVIEGDAGHEVGELLRRGTIAVKGDLGTFAGALMTGGSIVCFGNIGARAGASMERGTILAFNPLELLPTFRYSCTYQPAFVRTFLRELKKYGLPIEEKHIEGFYDRYDGDIASLGKGEILVFSKARGS
jgi:formylmethanofuran dehydrogenase subunit C